MGEGGIINAQLSNFAFALRNIFSEPVDSVVSVSGVIDWRRIQRPVQRTGHHVVAFGTVLAANVLDYANVAAFHDHVGRIVITVQDGPEMSAVRVTGLRRGVVGRSRQ